MSIDTSENALSPELSGTRYLPQEKRGSNIVEKAFAMVLVVGTTSDYIDILRRAKPDHALFLTAQSEREKAWQPCPMEHEEIICDLEENVALIFEKIRAHLDIWQITLDGIICFDCESMELTASLAEQLLLPYPSIASIRHCRDKFVTKSIWQKNGVPCPRNILARSADDVIKFRQDINAPCVIKPLSGSGSELVFHCSSLKECQKDTQLMLEGLSKRRQVRLYSRKTARFIAEEFVTGDEFSCDFTIKKGRIEILRLTRKIKYTKGYFGTIDGYMITDWNRSGINKNYLSAILREGALALGLFDAICMVDFIVDTNKILLLEMTPRPGGDCIPFLLNKAVGFDILSYFIDFARNIPSPLPVSTWSGEGLVALRLHSERSGRLVTINGNDLFQDNRTLEVNLIRDAGHRITMPPEDYDSWYLGHIIFRPSAGRSIEHQCHELRSLLEVEITNDSN